MSSIKALALAKAIGGGSGPSVTVEALTATENKVYTAPEGKAYNPVTVNVSGDIDIETLTVTENGTVTAPSGKAYGTVIVNVPPRTPRAAAPGGYNIGTFFSEYAWNSAAAQQAG